ncbi:hypothetical protein FSOLCH5_006070 [Fusarium solani]
MSFDDITDQYITYESRLASFHKSVKKRGSTAGGRGTKALAWPHKNISAASLARAGLFFNPTPQSPDNVNCFLCHKGLDGWEAFDDPLLEHLKHAPECGWAVVAAIEAEVGDYAQEDPNQPYMREARKATFAGRWPHDSKKGWKCKTKQLVDAGWKYTPTEDSDDMATCAYCQLALDGWEPGDMPLEEHFNRSPECPFFILLDEAQNHKKPPKSKAGRASKASRLSVQSVATATSEAPSLNESVAGPEDSVLTTASTQGGKKTKARKAAPKKGRKTKAKKEPVEEVEESIQEEAPPKPSRGKKRDSTAIEDASMAMSEAPAAKKRATRTRGSVAVPDSTLEQEEDVEMDEASAPKKGGRKKTKKVTKSTRTVSSTSVASEVSMPAYESTPGTFPDDDEIERQLEADLERQLTEDEEITVDSDSERLKAKKRGAKASKAKADQSQDYAMFDPEPAEVDEAEVDDELRALQAEMEVDEPEPEREPEPESDHEPEPETEPEPEPEPEPEELHVPKKGRKAGTRKVSKQTKSKKGKAAAQPVEEEDHTLPDETTQPEEVPERSTTPEWEPEMKEPAHEESMVSTDTVVKKSAAARSSAAGKRGRGRPSKASLVSQASADELELVEAPTQTPVETPEEPPVKRGRGRPSKASLASRASLGAEESQSSLAPPKRGRGRPSKKSLDARKSIEGEEAAQPSTQRSEEDVQDEVEVRSAKEQKGEHAAARVVSFESARPSSPPPSSAHLANPPSTPGRIISPAPSARQAAISPSQSPQSSDAENQPPSSKPAASANPKRVALAPPVSTPTRGSPSKRNMIVGLRSTTPWTELDLEAVFGSPRTNSDKENGADRFLKQGQSLTSPEKQMTVQEWIYHNAAEAENKLKLECESIVSRFENEGSKAMRVLEGLVVE